MTEESAEVGQALPGRARLPNSSEPTVRLHIALPREPGPHPTQLLCLLLVDPPLSCQGLHSGPTALPILGGHPPSFSVF